MTQPPRQKVTLTHLRRLLALLDFRPVYQARLRVTYARLRAGEIEPDDQDISVDFLRELIEQALKLPKTNP